MTQPVLCPSCGRPMIMLHALPRRPGDRADTTVNVFECRACKVCFTTEDHLPVPGVK